VVNERELNSFGNINIIHALVTVAAIMAAGAAAYVSLATAKDIAPVRERVVALESKQADDKERLTRIEAKVDRLIDMHMPAQKQ
jgi:hypothetical protein